MSRRVALIIVGTLAILMAGNTFGLSGGPPWTLNDGRLVIEEGCTCHGVGGGLTTNGSPTSQVTISISGVPRSYEPNTTYDLIINLLALFSRI